MKICYKCKVSKEIKEFSPSMKNSRKGFCTACATEYQRIWREKNRERHVANSKNYCNRHPKKIMVYNAKRRAKLQGVPFNLTENDFDIPEVCPVFGITFQQRGGPAKDYSPSLDRIIPRLGYVPENVVVISWKANRLKNDGTLREFEKLVIFLKKVLTDKATSDKRIEITPNIERFRGRVTKTV